MEMGQGGNALQESNTGVEVSVPSTPPDAREVTFGMQSNAGNSLDTGFLLHVLRNALHVNIFVCGIQQ